MNLPELQSAVKNALSGTSFSLAASVLGSSSIDSLFSSVFTAPTLVLSAASVTAIADGSTVKGTLTGAPQSNWSFLSGMQVTATFTLDSQSNAQVHLTLVPAASPWNILTTMTAWSSSLFGKFGWSDSQIDFDSAAPELLPAAFPTQYGLPAAPADTMATGLALTQSVAYTAGGVALNWLLGTDALVLAGPTAWDAALPEMDLVSPTYTKLAGNFSLGLSAHAVAALEPGSSTGKSLTSTPYIVLSGTLGRSGSAISVPINTVLTADPVTQIIITADYGGAGQFALTDIATFLGTSLAGQTPTSFPALQNLTLSPVVLTINPSGPAVDSISAAVGFAPAPWPSGNSVVQFTGFTIAFNAAFVPSPTVVTTTATATAAVGTGTLTAQLIFPGTDFTCVLDTGSTIDISALINQITGNLFSSLTLSCTALNFTGNCDAGTYTFVATVTSTNSWAFPVGGGSQLSLGFNSVTFNIACTTAAGKTSKLTGSVAAQFSVASTIVNLTAALPASGIWTFNGSTTGSQNIQLSALIDDVAAKFGLTVTAPSIAFTLTQLSLNVVAASPLTFAFSCATSFTLVGIPFALTLSLGRDDKQVTTFIGTLAVAAATFEVDFTSAPGGSTFTFILTAGSSPLTLQDLATAFDLGTITLPEALNPQLTSATFVYDSGANSVAFSASVSDDGVTGEIGFVSFIGSSAAKPRIGVFVLDVDLGVKLSSLPVVGQDIPTALDPGIETVQVIWASQTLDAADQTAFNTIWATLKGDTLTATTIDAGVTLAAALTVGSNAFPLVLPLNSPPATQTLALSAADSPSMGGQAKWFPVGKSLGPITLARVGIEYSNSTLYFLLDASLSLTILSIGLDGLGLGSPLTHFSPSFTLDGLSLSMSDGPITIAGGLLKVQNPPIGVTDDWVGDVTVAIAPYLISGSAGFAKIDGQASFFAFAQIAGDFGGPPAFFVTGFMGGFGYNSTLTLPTVDQVASFPFLNPTSFGSSPTPASVLAVLSGSGTTPAWVTPTVGEDWAAAGIMFRSFELILGQALLIADFGGVFEIALIGLASMSLPQGGSEECYAFIELEIEAVLKPSVGTFSIAASLTSNSFLITKDCHLTGGFAFCLWFGSSAIDPHTGDFVVTIGGYHPAFVVPAWYPNVARVGFNWQVDSNLSVQGGAYFALTPSAGMAGGNLQMLFQMGSLRAWFTAYCDLLIRWKPFAFIAGIGISVGVSYTLDLLFTSLTLSVELGATLNMYGPPTGGSASIDWYIISFSIPFGASQSSASPTVDWTGFQSLLPNGQTTTATRGLAATAATPSPTVLKLNVMGGLYDTDSTGQWVVRLANFTFSALTALPATSLLATSSTIASTTTLVNIRPMGLAGVTSAFTVSIAPASGNGTAPDLAGWAPAAQQSNLPEALYGAPLAATATPSAESVLIPNLYTGLQLTAPPPTAGNLVGPFAAAGIVEPLATGNLPLNPSAQDPLPVPAASTNSIPQIIATLGRGTAFAAQQATFAGLGTLGVAPPTSDPLAKLGASAGILFAQDPMLLSAY